MCDEILRPKLEEFSGIRKGRTPIFLHLFEEQEHGSVTSRPFRKLRQTNQPLRVLYVYFWAEMQTPAGPTGSRKKTVSGAETLMANTQFYPLQGLGFQDRTTKGLL